MKPKTLSVNAFGELNGESDDGNPRTQERSHDSESLAGLRFVRNRKALGQNGSSL